ncbi:MAG: outer membrane protein assembly factor BamA [Paracoccaceae bacterium]
MKLLPNIGRMLRALGMCLALVFALPDVLAEGAMAQSIQKLSFARIIVKGNLRIESATIRNFAGIKTRTPVTPGQINAAHQRLMATGLFERVTVTPRGASLVISVQEYPTINRINFERNKRIKDEDLAKLITSRARHTYSPAQAETDVQIIVEAYRQAGRFSVDVKPKIIRRADNRVDLVFEIFEGKVVEVQRLSFVGNRHFSDRRLRRVLSTKQVGLFHQLIKSDTFIVDRLEFDKQVLRDYYLSRGFIDFQILSATAEVRRNRNGFFVTFKVREGQSYRFGKLTTTSALADIDPDEFAAVMRIKKGTTYSPNLVERTIARMETRATQNGLNFIRVTPRVTRNDAERTLDIEFVIERGDRVFVERIDIEGNTTTLDRVIRREFETVEGDPFNPRQIRAAAGRIRALGFFAKADVTTREGTSADRVIIDVNVEDQPTGSFNFGVVYSGSSGVGGMMSLSENNFLGRGQFLKVELGGGTDNKNYGLSFADPRFLDRNLRVGVDLFQRTTTQASANYDTSSVGVSPNVTFPVSEKGRLALTYRWSSNALSNIGPNDVDDVTDPANPVAIPGQRTSSLITAGTNRVNALGMTYSYSNIAGGLAPGTGMRFKLSQEVAGPGSTVLFSKSTALVGARTRILNDSVTLSAEFEGGAMVVGAGAESPITERFFMGESIMRGYAVNGIGPRDMVAGNHDALGGNFYAVARLEVDFPLGFPEEYGIDGGLFYDVGSLWGLNNTAGGSAFDGPGTVDDSMILRQVVGFSIFWKTQIGPLRFNFTKVVSGPSYDKPESFSLTIGARF